MKPTRKLWQSLGIVFVLSFGVLGWLGREIYLAAPPIPATVQSVDGAVLYTGAQVEDGQRAWRAAGGQQLGTVWGHGALVAPEGDGHAAYADGARSRRRGPPLPQAAQRARGGR